MTKKRRWKRPPDVHPMSKAQRCPDCDGSGEYEDYFCPGSTVKVLFGCNACAGKGVVWVLPFEPLKPWTPSEEPEEPNDL